MKEAALCVGLKEFDDQETFDRVFELFITSTSTSEKVAAAKALGCSSNAILLSTYALLIFPPDLAPYDLKFKIQFQVHAKTYI